MGQEYAIRSLAPFNQISDWYHKRLLMPALAHTLFFRGEWLYYTFSLLITAFFFDRTTTVAAGPRPTAILVVHLPLHK